MKQAERWTRLLLDLYGRRTVHDEMQRCAPYSCTMTPRISSQCNHCAPSYIRIRKCPERHDPAGTTALALWAQKRRTKTKVKTPWVRGISSKSAKFSPPGNAGNQKAVCGYKLLPRFSCKPPCAFPPLCDQLSPSGPSGLV